MIRRYRAYRDSGVEWLGEVPEGWEVPRLRNAVRLITEKATETENPIGLENIEGGSGRFIVTDTEFAGDGVAFQPGDILFGKLRPYLAKVAVAERSGEAVGDFHVLRPRNDVDSRFLQYHLLAPAVISVIDGSTYGSKMPRAGWDFMAGLRIGLPSFAEQTAIAAFLDRETAKIDALVDEQRRLMALLREKRQAVISHAVTNGVNPAAPMKPSGVDWLGDVPEGWEVRSVSSLFELGRGRVISHEYMAENPGEFPVYSSQTERNGVMGSIGTFDFEGNYLTWTTDGANAGTVFHRSGRFNCTNVCGTLKPKEEINLEYMSFVLLGATGYYVRHDINPKLMNGVMAKIRVPLPTISEQTRIAQYIHDKTGHFAAVLATAESAIALLQERRAALISAAVTGKIDVRDLAPAETEAA